MKEKFLAGVENCLALFVNDYEFALLEKLTGYSPEQIACRPGAPEGSFTVVTRGQNGSDIYSPNDQIHIPVVSPTQIIDPTGVGDAYRGGFLTGYSNLFSLETCGQMGSLAATYCLEQRGTQTHSFRIEEFVDRFKRNFPQNTEIEKLTQ